MHGSGDKVARPASCLACAAGLARGLFLVLLAGALAAATWGLAGPEVAAVRATDPGLAHSFTDLLVVGCALALVVSALWLMTVTALVVLEGTVAAAGRSLPPRLGRAADVVTPRLVRHAVLGVCGLAVTSAATAAPALAASHLAGAPDRVTTTTKTISGLPLPDRPVGAIADRKRITQSATEVMVRPGDSLWSLAADQLPEHASAGDTTALWQAIYRTNADRLGPDPDRILPGTVLQLPNASPHRKEGR